MSDGTKIEWTDATVNAVNGCTRISPGCGGPGPHGGCYAELLAGTRLRDHPSRAGLTRQSSAGPRWTGKVSFNEKALLAPLAWTRPRRIFWNAHGDLFHENVLDEWVDKCFAVMALTPQHQHQVLTKRPARMRQYLAIEHKRADILDAASHLARDWKENARAVWHAETWPIPNVWLGTSVEDQQRADERIPDLLATPAAVRFLSCEPLLGPVDLAIIRLRRDGQTPTALSSKLGDYVQPLRGNFTDSPRINWVIVGGESGPRARPMHPDWARSLRDQCAAAGVPFFFKQWGEWAEVGHDEDGPRVTEVSTQRGRDMHSARARGPIGFISPNGRFFATEDDIRGRARLMHRIGKTAAGRLLDGVEHSEMPA